MLGVFFDIEIGFSVEGQASVLSFKIIIVRELASLVQPDFRAVRKLIVCLRLLRHDYGGGLL